MAAVCGSLNAWIFGCITSISMRGFWRSTTAKVRKIGRYPIPQTIVPALKQQLQKVIAVHEADLKAKFAGTFLPDQLDRKYKNAAKEFIWQWLFPAQSLTLLPEALEYRRYHIHESVVQKAIKKAVNDAKITKRASAHTFRHYLPFLTMSCRASPILYSLQTHLILSI